MANLTARLQLLLKTLNTVSMRFSSTAVATPCPRKIMESHPPETSTMEQRVTPYPLQGDLEVGARHGAKIIKSGGLIATPTDTVYGIAGDAQNDDAISRIYQIKGRISSKPIAICVPDIEQVYRWGKVNVSRSLLQDLLPGPVTLVFERQSLLNPSLNPDTNLIGIRIPDHKFIKSLADFHGGPIALTSANFSNEPSTLAVEEFKDMWPLLQCVFDGGRLSTCDKSEAAARAGSTVIDLSREGHFQIIRRGTAYDTCISILKDRYNLRELSS